MATQNVPLCLTSLINQVKLLGSFRVAPTEFFNEITFITNVFNLHVTHLLTSDPSPCLCMWAQHEASQLNGGSEPAGPSRQGPEPSKEEKGPNISAGILTPVQSD